MNKKRLTSAVLTGVMALSLAAPAFAADPQTVIAGTYSEIPISVVVPETGTAQINPYGLPVTLTKEDGKTVDLVGQQITTMPLSIKNQSATALDVNATLSVKPKGDVVIAAAKTTGKTIAVDLEVVGLNDATLALTSTSTKLDGALIDKFANKDTWTNAKKLSAPAAAKDTAPTSPSDSTANGGPGTLATLGAATPKGEVVTYGKDSIALFRLNGDLTAAPKDGTSADPWKAADGFTATIVFSFAPAGPNAGDSSVTVAITGSGATTGGTGATATFDAGTSGLTAVSYAWETDDENEEVVKLTGSGATVTLAQQATAGDGDEVEIKVTVTLSNGSTVEGTATFAAKV